MVQSVILWFGSPPEIGGCRTRAGKADGAVRGDDDIEFGATRLADQVFFSLVTGLRRSLSLKLSDTTE